MYGSLPENNRTMFWMQGKIPLSSNLFDRKPKTLQWYSSDSEENFKKRGGHAIYGPDDISYDFNSYGYRSIEPNPLSRNKKIAFFGCSFTSGIGLPYDHLWTTIATRKVAGYYGIEVEQHNFGLAAYGNDFIAQMVFQVVPFLKPDVVVVLFSQPVRRIHYVNFHERVPMMASNPPKGYDSEWEAFMSLQTDANDFYEWVKDFHLIDMVCKLNKVKFVWQVMDWALYPHYDTAYVPSTNRLPFYFSYPSFVATGDLARDGSHPGPITNSMFGNNLGDYIYQNKLLGR